MNNSSPRFPSNAACRPYNIVRKTQNPNWIFLITKDHYTLNTSQDLQLQIIFSSLLLSVFHYLMLYYFSMILCFQEQEAVVVVVNGA